MKLKTTEVNGVTYAVVGANGLPVYVHSDNSEREFDAAGTMQRIAGLNNEAKTHREAKEAAEARLKDFEGIDDAAAARAALTTVGNLKGGELKTAAQVEEIKEAARKAAETQQAEVARQSASKIAELTKERDTYQTNLYNEMVGGAFSRSGFVKDRIAIPADMVQDKFGKNFKVEDGKIVPYGPDGNKLYSKTRGGEVADFEEGLEYLIDSYPHKAAILKGTGNSGTGAPAGGPQGTGKTGAGGKPQMTRQAFEALGPLEKGEAARSHSIVDGAP